MMKIYLLLFLFFTSIGFSQEDAWVYFNAKPNSQSYLSTPLLMLSQRALDRRTNQNIVLDFKDVPVESSYVSQVKAVAGITVMAKSKWLNAIHVRGTQAIINSLKTTFKLILLTAADMSGIKNSYLKKLFFTILFFKNYG